MKEEATDSVVASASQSKCEKWLPKRYVLAIMCHLAFFIRGLVLVNFGMIMFIHLLTKMEDTDMEDTDKEQLPSISNFTFEEMANIAYSYNWVLAIGQVPSAILAFTFSPHKIMFMSIGLSFILQMVTPWTLTKSITGVVINVLLQGICLCPLDCACIGIWQKWAPSTDKTALLMISFGGRYAHFQIALKLSQYLAGSISLSSIYYFTGFAGAVWCILWCSLLKESPEQQCNEEISEGENNLKSIPLKSILMSVPVLGLCLVFICPVLCYRSLMTFIRLQIVGDMKNFGIWTIVVNCICIIPLVGILIDRLINGKKMKTTTARKILCSGGLILYVIFLALHLVPEQTISALCFIIAFIFMDLVAAGIVPNILDLSSRYCVLIMGIAMASMSVSGILSDYIHPLIFSEKNTQEWIVSQSPIAIVTLISALLYIAFGSAEEQPWSSSSLPTHCSDTEKKEEDETQVTKNV